MGGDGEPGEEREHAQAFQKRSSSSFQTGSSQALKKGFSSPDKEIRGKKKSFACDIVYFRNIFNQPPQDSSNRDLRLSKRPEWSEVEWQPPLLDKKDKTIVGKKCSPAAGASVLFFNLALKTVNTDTDTFYANYNMNGASSRAILAHRLYQLVTLCPTNSNFVLYFVPNFCLYNFLRFFPTMDKTEVNFV